MTPKEVMREVRNMLDQVKSAILSTIDNEGRPHMRWMTPVMLRGQDSAIYAVTSPDSLKVSHLGNNANIEWMIQPLSLTAVINLKGKINIIDNPSLKAQIMEELARRLTVFWKLNRDKGEYVVLETVIEEAVYFRTVDGEYFYVKF